MRFIHFTVFLLFSFLQIKGAHASEKYAWVTSIGAAPSKYHLLLQAGIESVLNCCANELLPVILFEGTVEDAPSWLRILHDNHLVLILPHRLSWYDSLTPNQQRISASYSRMEIPLIMHKIVEKYPNVSSQYALYTDSDALFIKMPPFLKPAILALGAESTKGKKDNSGVIFFNNQGILPYIPDYIQYASENGNTGDQPLTLHFFRNKSDLLPDAYNWKPYWGVNPDAYIWHTHGTKYATCMEDFVILRYDPGHEYGKKAKCSAAIPYSGVHRHIYGMYKLSFEGQMAGYSKYFIDLYTALNKFNDRILKLTNGKLVHSFYSKKTHHS